MLKTSSKPILSIKILVFRINPSKEFLCRVDWSAKEGEGEGSIGCREIRMAVLAGVSTLRLMRSGTDQLVFVL